MPAKWTTDLIAESKMRSLGVDFEFVESIELSRVDVMGSRRNNARLADQWSEELSIEYAVAMHDGDVFPAPVFRRGNPPFDYFVMSGNHRIGAAKLLEDSSVSAYVVKSTDEMACEIITRAANRWMGDRQSKDEAVEHARALIAKYHRTQEEMAKLFGLKSQWLSSAIRAEEARDSLERLSINSRELPRASILLLSQLDSNEVVFKRAGLIASKYKLASHRVKDMVSAAKAMKTESAALECLKEFEQPLKQETSVAVVQSSPIYSRPERTRLFQYLNTLHNFLSTGRTGQPFLTLDQLGVTSQHDRKELRERWKQVRLSFEEMFRLADRTALNGHGGRPITSKKRRKKTNA